LTNFFAFKTALHLFAVDLDIYLRHFQTDFHWHPKIISAVYPQIHLEQMNTVSCFLHSPESNYLYQNYFPFSMLFNRNVTAFLCACKPSVQP
jgi:hypothetical protein